MRSYDIHRLGLWLFGLGAALLGCSATEVPAHNTTPTISFYEWSPKPTIDTKWINVYQPNRLYIKALDFADTKGLALTKTPMPDLGATEVVPVVFIDHRLLSKYALTRFTHVITASLSGSKYPHIQLDCDWTLSTKTVYFELLKVLSEHYAKLSVTIRLHQIKYAKTTGVPPVQRGVLMYYNMSDLKDFETKNYILDLDVGKQYHFNFDTYPLPLDLGLPLYRQARVFRHESLVGLIDFEALQMQHLKVRSADDGTLLTVTQSHYAGGDFLYEGDQLKIDRVEFNDLVSAVKALRPILSPKEVIFFDRRSTHYFKPDELKQLSAIFGD
jgi:hypothetical protein